MQLIENRSRAYLNCRLFSWWFLSCLCGLGNCFAFTSPQMGICDLFNIATINVMTFVDGSHGFTCSKCCHFVERPYDNVFVSEQHRIAWRTKASKEKVNLYHRKQTKDKLFHIIIYYLILLAILPSQEGSGRKRPSEVYNRVKREKRGKNKIINSNGRRQANNEEGLFLWNFSILPCSRIRARDDSARKKKFNKSSYYKSSWHSSLFTSFSPPSSGNSYRTPWTIFAQ